jgi:hypothetical protein
MADFDDVREWMIDRSKGIGSDAWEWPGWGAIDANIPAAGAAAMPRPLLNVEVPWPPRRIGFCLLPDPTNPISYQVRYGVGPAMASETLPPGIYVRGCQNLTIATLGNAGNVTTGAAFAWLE